MRELRQEYDGDALTIGELPETPIRLFEVWFLRACEEQQMANAFSLATSDGEGGPTVRVVLLKRYGSAGFEFVTNYESEKGGQLRENPVAEMCFWWPSLHRQVRIRGYVEKTSYAVSEQYFLGRPAESNYSAVASPQSSAVTLQELKSLVRDVRDQQSIQRPAHWGAFRIVPKRFEFWQGRPSRLHDRMVYEYEDSLWTRFRIAP